MNYYTSRDSLVLMASLDAAKAFDKVNHYAFFSKLMSIGIPLYVLNVLICWFMELAGKVLWNGAFSATFCVKCSVRQGEIFSSCFFNLYINFTFVMNMLVAYFLRMTYFYYLPPC